MRPCCTLSMHLIATYSIGETIKRQYWLGTHSDILRPAMIDLGLSQVGYMC